MRVVRRFLMLKNGLILSLRGAVYKSEPQVMIDVSFVSQFASPEYAEQILKDGVDKTSDPRWSESGARSPTEYADWVTTMCGMACFSMALKYFLQVDAKLVALAKTAHLAGVYDESDGVLTGLKYYEFTQFAPRFGVRAQAYRQLSLGGIKHLLTQGRLIMVSVNPNIRGYETAPPDQVGGHLVLITGYDTVTQTITINNPSGFVSLGTTIHTLPETEFQRYFAGRGIAMSRQ